MIGCGDDLMGDTFEKRPRPRAFTQEALKLADLCGDLECLARRRVLDSDFDLSSGKR